MFNCLNFDQMKCLFEIIKLNTVILFHLFPSLIVEKLTETGKFSRYDNSCGFSCFSVSNRKVTWNTKYSMIYIDNPVSILSYDAADDSPISIHTKLRRSGFAVTNFLQVNTQPQV